MDNFIDMAFNVNIKNRKLILDQIKSRIKKIDNTAEVILFGSQARNDVNSNSDWDILILSDQNISLGQERKFRHQLFYVELEFDISITTILKRKRDWKNKAKWSPLAENIYLDGQVV